MENIQQMESSHFRDWIQTKVELAIQSKQISKPFKEMISDTKDSELFKNNIPPQNST